MIHSSFDSPSQCYKIFYDESNNARRLSINERDDSYNIDNDKSQVAAVNFMLGGVAHRGATSTSEVVQLFNALRLPPKATELKFKQVARGAFDAVLKSQQIRTLLTWLRDSDLYVHFFNLNMEYWSFVDIIDDCADFCWRTGKLKDAFPGADFYRFYLDYHKDALHQVIRAKKTEFLRMVKGYGYPAIEGKERAFIGSLNKLVSDYMVEVSSATPRPPREAVMPFLSLTELLSLSEDIDDMSSTHQSEANVLIDGFSVFYSNRASTFSYSEHIFDEEFTVQEEIDSLQASGLGPVMQYRFVKSHLSPLTQVSDVIAGLFGKYFDFIDKNCVEELAQMKAGFNSIQNENLALMKSLVEKTHDECEYLLFYVMTMSEHHKHRLFLFDGGD